MLISFFFKRFVRGSSHMVLRMRSSAEWESGINRQSHKDAVNRQESCFCAGNMHKQISRHFHCQTEASVECLSSAIHY